MAETQPSAPALLRNRVVLRLSLGALVLALLTLRIILWPIADNSDLQGSFLPWQQFLIEHGRWRAMQHPIGDYLPAYYDLTTLLSYASPHLSVLAQVKLLPFLFDIVAAVVSYGVVRRLSAPGSRAPLVAFFSVLAGPTVILNGAVWGQCDIVYTTFLLITLWALLRGRPRWAALALGFAFALKLQAIFLAPFIGAMLWQRRIRVRDLLLLPIGWMAALVPPLLAGASLREYLLLPAKQGQARSELSIEIGNIYVLAKLVHLNQRIGLVLGVALTLVVGAAIVYYGSRQSFRNPRATVLLAALSLLAMPYVMPRMHDRYFFPGEIVLLLLACVEFELLLPAALVLSGSLIAYACFFEPALRHWVMPIALLANSAGLFLVGQRCVAVMGGEHSGDRSPDAEAPRHFTY